MSVMVAMLAATAAFVVIVVPPDRGDYLAVITDKMEMIESAQGPKSSSWAVPIWRLVWTARG